MMVDDDSKPSARVASASRPWLDEAAATLADSDVAVVPVRRGPLGRIGTADRLPAFQPEKRAQLLR